ncbi:hypothetical protein [Limnothrix sp. FACHB-881]|uniref:hypothetical protein n=1 Tax=Limnothrix sp. FACHB-881 TaxID=2692819 RepID=UPI0016831562|nr:hypothetical protein [Limnothrix sp. FACHB-881]
MPPLWPPMLDPHGRSGMEITEWRSGHDFPFSFGMNSPKDWCFWLTLPWLLHRI